MNVSRPLRAVRAAVFAAVCVVLSATGHEWMSGRPVPPWALVLAALLTFLAASAGAGRRRGFGSIAALMLAGELGLHLLFSAAQRAAEAHAAPSSAMPMSGMSMGVAQHPSGSMPGMLGTPSMPGMPAMPDSPSDAFSPGSWLMRVAMSHGAIGMVAVHAAAGLLCAWWIHAGERAVFGVLQWVLALTAAVFALPSEDVEPVFVPVVPRRAAPPRLVQRGSYPEPLIHVLVRRGPPRMAGF